MATGYGSDLSCMTKLSTGRTVRGRVALGEALFRRFSTPRGTLPGDKEESTYGFDLSYYLGAVGDQVALAALPVLAEAEALKDERVAACTVTAESATAVNETGLLVTLSVTPFDETENFEFTLAVTDASVSLVGGF